MEGKIQVGGLMSFNVGTNLNTYGEELSTLKVSPDAEYIKICLPSYGSSACFPVEKTDGEWESQSILVTKGCPENAPAVPNTYNEVCNQYTQIV